MAGLFLFTGVIIRRIRRMVGFRSARSLRHRDGEGNAEYLTAVIRELLRSTEFVDGLTGEGWQLWIDQLTGLTT